MQDEAFRMKNGDANSYPNLLHYNKKLIHPHKYDKGTPHGYASDNPD